MGIFGGSTAGQPRYSGELHNLSVTEAVFGTCAPIVFGTCRVHQKLLFYGGFYAVTAPNSGGKGIFGGKTTEWDYYADVLMLLAQGSLTKGCAGIINVWDQQGKLENQSTTVDFAIASGSTIYVPPGDAVISDLGVYTVVPYTQAFTDYGGGSGVLSGNQSIVFINTTGTPVSGEYYFDPTTRTYTFSTADIGKTVTISYSTVFSLYYCERTQGAEIPGAPYQISTDNQTYFWQDQGVTYVDTGLPCTAYTQSDGVYTFTSADVGRLVYIKYTYTTSSADLTNTSSLNLSFFSGAKGQAPWSYMTSKYPGSNFGYSGLCYLGANPLYLGQAGAMPSYNYELVGLVPFGGGNLDAHPCDALRLLLTDPLLGVNFPSANLDSWTSAYAYWASNNYFISKCIDTQTPASDALQEVISTGNVAPVWSAGMLKLIPYGDTTTVGNGYTYTPATTPVATLTWDDLLSPSDKRVGDSSSDDPLQVAVKAPQDCMNYVQAQWANRENDYNNELTPEQNDAFIKQYGFRPESPQTWDFITTQATATWALNLRLKRNCYIRNTYKFWLPFWFSALEPMDMVVLPTGEPVRITSIDDDSNGKLAIEAEQWSYGTADVTIYPKQSPTSYQPTQSQAIPGNTYPVIFEATPQAVLSQPNTVQFAVAGNQAAWGGCNVYASPDGDTWTQIAQLKSQGRTGLLSAVLPSTVDPDTTSTLSVDMTISGGELVNVTAAQRDSFVTLAAIVDASGSIELISYEIANLTTQNRYNITSLRRGVYGTAIGAHAIGAEFAYIGSTGIFNYQYPAQYAGTTMYFKFASFNTRGLQVQELSQCIEYSFLIPGTTLQPPSSGSFSINPASVLTAQTAGSSSQITVAGFIAQLTGQKVACNPPSPVTGLSPGMSYWVYYIDRAFEGGAITPIATQDALDFSGKAGYYNLVGPNTNGTITTPTTGSVYRPTSYTDTGNGTTLNAQYAYDASPSTQAELYGISTDALGSGLDTVIDCTWEGFSATSIATSKTLTVNAAFGIYTQGTGTAGIVVLKASLNNGSTWTILETATSIVTQANYTLTVPSGTVLSSVLVRCIATPGPVVSGGSNEAIGYVYDINIQ